MRDRSASARQPVQLIVGHVHVVGEHRALAQQAGALVRVEVVARLGNSVRTKSISPGLSLMWLVNSAPGASSSSARQASSIGSLHETAKRGVTA